MSHLGLAKPRARESVGRVAHKLSGAIALLLLLLAPQYTGAYSGRVIDASTRKPVEGAFVTLNESVVRTDENGVFQVDGSGNKIGARAYGYARNEVATTDLKTGAQEIHLTPLKPKALYLSFFGIGHTGLRQSALKLVKDTELNALVIDVKGDRGSIAYKSSIPLAAEVGAQDPITIKDVNGLIRSLRASGIYTIARIVVFKDSPLALARPDLAVKNRSGAIFRDREHLAWTDPFEKEVWNYNIGVALEAAGAGFDEIQFDYVRFPDAPGLVFSMANTEKNRIAAISGFLAEARKRLVPYNVFLAADMFGYVNWNLDDTHIGQKLEELVPIVDYVSPMLYPSCFQFGIPGYRNPVQHPYEIVYLSLKRARDRTDVPSIRFRPWLQAFRDYEFDRRPFKGKEIRAQITAAETFGSDGWMLWNSNNVYSEEGLKKAGSEVPLVGGACFQDY